MGEEQRIGAFAAGFDQGLPPADRCQVLIVGEEQVGDQIAAEEQVLSGFEFVHAVLQLGQQVKCHRVVGVAQAVVLVEGGEQVVVFKEGRNPDPGVEGPVGEGIGAGEH